MTLRPFALIALLPLAAWAQTSKELVGKYVMEADASDVMELRADGTATMEGEQTKWSVKGNQLSIGPDTMAFQLVGARLLLSMGSVQLGWKRVGAASKGPTPMEKAAAKAKAAQPEVSEEEADREAMQQANAWLAAQGQAPGPQVQPGPRQAAPRAAPPQPTTPVPPGGGSPQDAQLRQLLLSSAWCSFTYNQHTGTSTTRRVVFRPDGLMLTNAGGETFNSGPNGTVAGQAVDGSTSRWQVSNLRLLVDQGQGFQDVGLTGTRNSSGSPILTAAGREYSMCR
jgi:hypothetical protein